MPINIDSGNGLVPLGDTLWPDFMLTNLYISPYCVIRGHRFYEGDNTMIHMNVKTGQFATEMLTRKLFRVYERNIKLCITGPWRGESDDGGCIPTHRAIMQKVFSCHNVIMCYAIQFYHETIFAM